ncbi:transcriptional activator protein UGA3 [Microdochium nivale]|nr:transcriptional activator protein UGA3 [Microdochium nivale]
MSSAGSASPPGADAEPPKKRIRKSRSRGLRTKSGCLTCRKRHKKCDENVPLCGPCSISSRDCVYAEGDPPLRPPPAPAPAGPSLIPSSQPRIPTSVPAAITKTAPAAGTTPPITNPSLSLHTKSPDGLFMGSQRGSPAIANMPSPYGGMYSSPGALPPGNHMTGTDGTDPYQPQWGYSPETIASELLSADLASTRWLDLLATDAAQADGGFSLTATPAPAPSPAPEGGNIVYDGLSDPQAAVIRAAAESEAVASEKDAWQLSEDIVLSEHETVLFRLFAERAALWLDLFDPFKHFSTYMPRLALRNQGIMKAILALTSRHKALQEARAARTAQMDSAQPARVVSENHNENGVPPAAAASKEDPNDAVQYYYETLHYIQTALRYNSYAHSEELLGTAIVISTYEMLDQSDSNWQRHLKGVFWIQRSQNSHGSCGGLRQAVWWAWLRQDIWAAFRERRRCLSFWRPVKNFHELSQHELADHAVYLLSQTVNFCAKPDVNSVDPVVVQRRAQSGEALLGMLERWKSFTGPKFRPLPSPVSAGREGMAAVFQPLWMHPPEFGVSMQVYHFARILITLHSPATGFDGYLRTQKILAEAVATICGIAMELKDEGCQIMSAQCLFGAGLCVQDDVKRNHVLSLIDSCEARTGWSMNEMKNDLRTEWAKVG